MVEVRDDEHTIKIPTLKWDMDALGSFTCSYDKQRDTLFVYKAPKSGAVSFDVGGHLWIRFNPNTGDVIGVEIEDFEQVFLIRYPELRLSWEQLKPRIIKHRKPDRNAIAEYLRLLLLHIKGILKDHPHQMYLPPL